MHVQRVAMPVALVESWTVVDGDGVPVEPVERYLAYLTAIERSPNTIRAYAFDLRDYWVSCSSGAWNGGGCGWKTSASTWRGCGCRPPGGRAGWRCCQRLNRTSRRPRSTGSWQRWRRSISIRPGTAPTSVSC
jgi:hypothetical protein